MIVKFRCNGSSSYDYGWKGFSAALTTIATAAAGSNPSNPNSTILPYWEVIADDVAGGWSVNTDDWNGGAGTATSGYIRLYTASAKGTDTYKTKGIQFFTNSTSQDSYYGHIQPQVYTGDATGTPIATAWLQPYGGSTSTARYDTWSWNYPFNGTHDFIMVCTQEYLYVWMVDEGLNDMAGNKYRVVGVADHTYSSPVEADPASQHMPFYGIGIMNSSDQYSTNDASQSNIHVSFTQHVNPSGFFNSLITGYNYYIAEHDKTSSPNVVTQNYITALYPKFYSNNASGSYTAKHYMSSTFNTQGLESSTINDIMITGPAKGTFTRVLKGIKWAGVNRASSGLSIKANDFQEATLISDEDTPQEYFAIASGGHVFCHPKK